MPVHPTPRLRPSLIGLGLLALSAMGPHAEAGGWPHKKGQLVAVPTAAQAAAPVQVFSAVPVQAAQFGVVQVQQAPIAMAAAPIQLGVVTAQAATAPTPPPTIHITVVESSQAQAAPTAQAQGTGQSQVQLGTAPTQAYLIDAAAPVVPRAAPVAQAVPVQLFYIPPRHKCSIFCKH